MSVVARGRAAQLQEPEAIALAKKFYDEKGPFVGAFSMAIPVLSAHRNRGYGGRAEWSIKYRVEPDTGDEYFVRFFYQRPFGAPGWEVQNMHLCDGNCSASCVKRPHEGFGTARLDLHTYRMQVQAMKVDELRSMCVAKQLGDRGKKDALVKRLLDFAEKEDEAARLAEQEAETERIAQEAEAEAGTSAAAAALVDTGLKRKAAAEPAAGAAAKRPAAASTSASASAAAAALSDFSDDSSDSDDDLLTVSLNPTKNPWQLEAEAKARREMQLKRQGQKPEGPSFEEEVARMEQDAADKSAKKKKKGGAAAAGAAAATAIDLSSESAQIVRALYEIERASAMASAALPEKPTPISFKPEFELMQHQKQALAWMQEREASRVPLSGGILADEMGLGKTAECLSVIVSDMEEQKQLSSRPGPTLIVCPTSVVDSWETEIYSRFAPAFRPAFLVYYGDAKLLSAEQLQDLDIVVTTFGSLLPAGLQLRSFKTDFDAAKAVKQSQHPLFAVKWRRVILDEAHYIRNHNSESARACRLLNAERRWAVTGTPIQNGVNDLLSLFMFLQFRPVDTPKLFHAEFGGNQKRDWDTGQQKSAPVNIRKLHAVLSPVMLRRRKDSKKADGTPIVQLPKKTILVTEANFSPEEAEFYTQLETRMAARFKKFADEGLVYQNYTNVLVMIQKLRQACNHPHLATNGKVATPGYQEEGKSLLDSLDAAGITAVPEAPPEGTSSSIPAPIEEKLERLRDILNPPFEETCPICLDMLDAPASVVCLCGHLYCKDCITEWRDADGNSPCPECRAPLDADPLTPLPNVQARVNEKWPPPPKVKAEQKRIKAEKAAAEAAEAAAAAAGAPKVKRKFLASAKLIKLMEELKKMKANDSTMKCIVFSNFTSFLDLCMTTMKHSGDGFRAVRVDGSMDMKSRQKQLQIFRTDSRVSVLVMSLKAGSHGLNLTSANNVVLCEPWWNPMPEQQAMDRVHRTGQQKPVTVIKLTVDGTIEQRILEMQASKWQVADSVLGEDSGMSGDGGKKARKLSIQELFSLFGMKR